jgi:hypothetical protein
LRATRSDGWVWRRLWGCEEVGRSSSATGGCTGRDEAEGRARTCVTLWRCDGRALAYRSAHCLR